MAASRTDIADYIDHPHGGILKAEQGGQIKGFLGFVMPYVPLTAEITHLYVSEKRQRTGIDLLDAFCQFAHVLGCKRVTLEASAEGSDFYQHAGLEIIQRYAQADVADYLQKRRRRYD